TSRPAFGCGGAGFASDSTRRGFGRVEGTRRRAAEGGTFGETEVAPGADGAFDFTATGGLASGASRRTGEGDDGILDGPGGVVAPPATKPPQFVQMNRIPTSPFSRTRFGSRSRNCFGWRKPASNNFSARSRSRPKARLSRTTASSITKAPQFPHSVSSGGMGS